MWLVVYLGNVGEQYRMTRHNYGFIVGDALTSGWKTSKDLRCDLDPYCLVGTNKNGPQRFVAMKPSTYMNDSGDAVRKVSEYYKIPTEQTIVVHDDVGLDLGKIKIKQGGGTGGHNGLKSIDAAIGSNYFRIRCGIGKPAEGKDMIGHVLGTFENEEFSIVNKTAHDINNSLSVLIVEGLQKAQDDLNKNLEAK